MVYVGVCFESVGQFLHERQRDGGVEWNRVEGIQLMYLDAVTCMQV